MKNIFNHFQRAFSCRKMSQTLEFAFKSYLLMTIMLFVILFQKISCIKTLVSKYTIVDTFVLTEHAHVTSFSIRQSHVTVWHSGLSNLQFRTLHISKYRFIQLLVLRSTKITI